MSTHVYSEFQVVLWAGNHVGASKSQLFIPKNDSALLYTVLTQMKFISTNMFYNFYKF